MKLHSHERERAVANAHNLVRIGAGSDDEIGRQAALHGGERGVGGGLGGDAVDGSMTTGSNRCTVDDVRAAGVCGSADVREIACGGEEDCLRFRADCDTEIGHCVCGSLRRKLHRKR